MNDMKMKLVDGTIYDISRAEIIEGRLEIDMLEKTAEEVQAIFSTPGKLQEIELLTSEEEAFSELQGWTKLGAVMLNGEVKTAILTQPADVTEERVTNAEAKATAANAAAVRAEGRAETAEKLGNDNAEQITDLQMALCEIYEGMGV